MSLDLRKNLSKMLPCRYASWSTFSKPLCFTSGNHHPFLKSTSASPVCFNLLTLSESATASSNIFQSVSELANQEKMEDQGAKLNPEKIEAVEVENKEKHCQDRPGIAVSEQSGMESVEGTLPIEPWHIGGPVIKGFGRGSKVLGIPTANLSAEGYSNLLQEHPCGVYFGWAGLSNRGVFKMVMSIGWNPYFKNAEKTIEPWLLHDFNEDFYGEELHLVIVGYIRPEANFSSLDSLIAKIYEDRDIAEKALELPRYAKYKNDPYLHDIDTLQENLVSGEQ